MFVNDNGVIRTTENFPKRFSVRKAKKLSVKKWEYILSEALSGKFIAKCGGSSTCALCIKFACDCVKCPVHKRVGGSCHSSPWFNVIRGGFTESTIKAEIDFLKSL